MASTVTPNRLGNRYELQDKLGEGGMGAVYKAKDLLTGETVALKRVLIEPIDLVFNSRASTSKLKIALAREFRVLASLRHPNIISVLDYGFDDGHQPFFTMSYLENTTTLLEASRNLTVKQIVDIVIQVLQALTYLHRHGILHRDLKPGNILIDANLHVRVLDFGLAVDQSQAKGFVGTLAYIAPEILKQQKATRATDLYAIGVILYRLLSGELPFDASNQLEFFSNVISSDPDLTKIDWILETPPQAKPELSSDFYQDPTIIEDDVTVMVSDSESTQVQDVTRLPDIDKERIPSSNQRNAIKHPLVKIIARLLAKSPEQRYSDATDLIEALSEAIGEPPPRETSLIRESYLQASKFVGREEEIGQLQNMMDDAIGERGSAWLIGGESGVGKTRMLEEIRPYALTRGALVLRGQGIAEGGRSYELWRDPIRRLLITTKITDFQASVLYDIVPDIEELIGRKVNLAPTIEGKIKQQRIVQVIADVFRKQTKPIMLILEDLQWAIESIEPLKQLLRYINELPLLIISTYRDDERPALPEELPGMNLIKLGRLSEKAVEQLSISMLGDVGKQKELVTLLQKETEGNAFFIVEVVRALAEEAGRLSSIGTLELPHEVITGGIKQIVSRRLAHVPLDYHPLLKLAAVNGRPIDEKLLHYLAPEIDIDQWLYRCGEAAVLEVQEGQWRFAHDKLREILLAAVPSDEKRDLHRQVAEALEAVYKDSALNTANLAEHWYKANIIDKALHYSLVAGEQHLQVSAFKEALALAERGLINVDALADPNLTHIQFLQLAGDATVRMGLYDDAKSYFEEAVILARQLDIPQKVTQALGGLARTTWRLGNLDDALNYATETLGIAEQIGDRATMASCLSTLGGVALYQGNFDEAITYLLEGLALQRETDNKVGENSVLNDLGVAMALTGDSAQALMYFDQSRQICSAIGDKQGTAYGFINLGSLALQEKNFDDAIGYLQNGLAIFEDIADKWGVGSVHIGLFDAYFGLKNYDEALRHLHQGLENSHAIGAVPNILEGLAAYAQVRHKRKNYKQSAELVGLVSNHPALTSETEMRLEDLMALLRTQLDEQPLAIAIKKGKELDFETTADMVLAEIQMVVNQP